MLIDEIRKANTEAMKQRRLVEKNAYSLIIAKFLNLQSDYKAKGKEVTDNDVISLITKTLSELEEERKMYLTNNRSEQVAEIEMQIKALEVYKPSFLSESEIKDIILTLEDKSIKNVMTHFKTNYAGKVEMKTVNKVLGEINK